MTTLIHSLWWGIFGLEVHLEQIFSILRGNTDPLISNPNIDTDFALLVDEGELIHGHANCIFGRWKLKTVLDQVY